MYHAPPCISTGGPHWRGPHAQWLVKRHLDYNLVIIDTIHQSVTRKVSHVSRFVLLVFVFTGTLSAAVGGHVRRVAMILRSAFSRLALGARRSLSTSILPEVSREWTPQSRRCGALGMKGGMTHDWSQWGQFMPLTVVELQDVQVVQQKLLERDGYTSLKLGAGWQKRKRLTRADAGQYTKSGLPLKQYMREFRVSEDALLPAGSTSTARHFAPGQYVDVQGVSRGKGFTGVMQRWGFKGQPASHGHSLSHRSRGSSAGAAGSRYATRVRKGTKMAGRVGNKRRTASSLLVYKVDPAHNILYLKGSVPGPAGGIVRLKDAERSNTKKLMRKHGVLPPFPSFFPGDPGDGDDAILVSPPTDIDPIAVTYTGG